MKKTLFIVGLLFVSLSSYSQMWDIIAWAQYNKIESMYNNELRVGFSPLLESYKGHDVFLRPTINTRNNVYKGYNYKTKDTKRELEHANLIPYVYKTYHVEDVILDVDDFFNMGCLFVLVNDNGEHIYVQRGYRNLLLNLAESFNDVFYSKNFYTRLVQQSVDKFDNKTWLSTIPICIDAEKRYNRCLASAGRDIQGNDTIYYIDIAIDSKREISSKTDCFINLLNGLQLRFYDLSAKSQYDREKDSFLYGVQIPLSPEQFKVFTEEPIRDVKIFDIPITDIMNFYGKLFQFTCKALYEEF